MSKTRMMFTATLAVILGTALVRPALAELQARDDAVFGTKAFVYDSDTGLQWLRIPLSGTKSYNDMSGADGSSEFAPGRPFAGFRYATMAEVKVDKNTGHVQVERVVCAQDMGIVINPEGATIQMEGCITMGLGYALSEDIHFKGGMILENNFDSYELPRFSTLPKIETVLVEHNDLSPQGGGEPAIITMGAVVANAIDDAVGARVFQLPMTPERVKNALKTS